MSKQGILISVAEDQEGKLPKIVTRDDRSPIVSDAVDIARGNVTGSRPFSAYGERVVGAGEVNRVVWPNGVFTIPDIAGVQMTVVSTSADDDEAGTNARVVEIHYLDINLNEQEEHVTLQGLTPVVTAATDIRFINCMHVHEWGTDPSAAGDITAYVGATTYSQIAAGDTRCSSSARMVPKGKRLFVAGMVAGATSGTAAAKVKVRIASSAFEEHNYTYPLTLIPGGAVGLQDNSVTFNQPIPLPVPAGAVVAMTVTADKAADVTASWFGWIEDA